MSVPVSVPDFRLLPRLAASVVAFTCIIAGGCSCQTDDSSSSRRTVTSRDAAGNVARAAVSPQAGSFAPLDDPPVPVRLGSFVRGEIHSTLRVHAKLEAVEDAEVYPEITGVVREVVRREGDPVSKGDPIVRLDERELRLAAGARKALWEQAVSKVGLAELSASEQGQIVLTKKLLQEKGQIEFDRVKDLLESSARSKLEGVISKEEFDAKRYALEEAKINYKTALLQESKAKLDHILAQQTERQSKLEYDTAEYKVSQATLTSPIDGAVTFLDLDPGELLTSSKLAFKVVNGTELEARLFVPQKELARLVVGQHVRILCEVFPERIFAGSVEVINPVVDIDNGMVRLIVGVTDPKAQDFLKPGMFINGEVILEAHDNALLVGKRSILYENQEPVLFLVEDGVARRYVVKTGFSDKDRVEVLELIDADGNPLAKIPETGALVVLGQNNLKHGSRVEVTTAGPRVAPRSSADTPRQRS